VSHRLKDKVAIVTGAGSSAPGIGNGRAAAILFARQGAKVLLVDQNEAAAKETLEMIAAEKGVAAVHAPADVSRNDDCRAAAAAAVSRWGRLDILLNNVGVSARMRASVVDLPPEEWLRVMTVNVHSMMLMCKHAVPEMKKSGGGSIINISSFGGLFPSAGNNAYATSKGAVIAFTRSIAVDHGADGIRANCILPGMMATPMGLANKKGGAETEAEKLERQKSERDRRLKGTLLGIEGTGWDIGNAALFLASDEARYITGIDVLVDGGAALR
jgi:NAD(P)-dependent dehydrogenase (short-subunit alcohol dehydrogenase family)